MYSRRSLHQIQIRSATKLVLSMLKGERTKREEINEKN